MCHNFNCQLSTFHMSIFLNLIVIIIIIRLWLSNCQSACFVKAELISLKAVRFLLNLCLVLLQSALLRLSSPYQRQSDSHWICISFCSDLLCQCWTCLVEGSWILTEPISCSAPVCFVKALSALLTVDPQTQDSYFSWIIIQILAYLITCWFLFI